MGEGADVRRGRRRSRPLCPLAWGALLGALISGCNQGDTPENATGPTGTGRVTIRFLRHNNPNYVTADSTFFAAYEAAHPNVRIEDTTVDFNTLAGLLVGDLIQDTFEYDLVLIPPSRMCGLAAHVKDVPEDVITLARAREVYFSAPLSGSVCEGKLKGLPVEYNLEYGGVVLNVGKYQARFPGQTPGSWADWRAFITQATGLAEYDDAGIIRANGLDIDPAWPPAAREIFLSQILQRGGRYWVDSGVGDTMAFDASEGDTLNFTTPEARATLAEMVSWIVDDRIMSRSLVPPANTHVTTRLAAGAAGFGWNDPARPLSVMGYVGTAGVPSTVAELPPGSPWVFDFFPVPPMVGTEHVFVQDSGWAFAVPNTSRNPAVAWDIARSLALSAEDMRLWSSVTGALPALKENATPETAAEHPYAPKVLHLLPRGRWLGYVPVEAIDAFGGAILTNYFAAASGEKTIDQALLDMQTTANNAIVEALK
jgi:multiple sugar transport system substrate-binding protein